jgi:DnaJ like chaperone protein
MPEEVRRALRLFDLNEGVSWENAKAKYRKCMSEYHPDKVAHLGADLRKLAEEKTKAYNAAYNDIQRYFEEVNKHQKTQS